MHRVVEGKDDEMKIYVKIAKILCNVARTRSELVGIADVSEQVHGGRLDARDGRK